jgi:tetratricopeptide (TPR) repeat protein
MFFRTGNERGKGIIMGYTDAQGLAVSTTSVDALAAYERGIDLYLRWRTGAPEAIQAAVTADPHFALAYCTRAYMAWRMGNIPMANEAHSQVMRLADTVSDPREHLHVQAVEAMQRTDQAMAQSLLEQIAAHYPTDRMAIRTLSFLCIAQGKYTHGLEIARRCLEAAPDDPQFLTMAGFFLEQSGYNDEGLAMSLRSLALDPTSLYTYHSVGHAYQARGDYRSTLETFERAASLEHYPHVLWHLAEAQAILGYERLTRDYWATASPPLPLFERIELLWRLEALRQASVDEATWKDLAAQGERLLEHADYLTTWMHHWIGLALARAGQFDKAQRQIERFRRLPAGAASGHWSTLGADLLAGELAFMRGDLAEAARLMAPAIQHLHTMGGGSREQKDIFRDVFLEIQCRLGHAEQVIELAQQRLLANPYHIQSLAALVWAYGQQDQTALQRHTCRQLVQRAAEIGVHPQTPALLEAQRVLQDVP